MIKRKIILLWFLFPFFAQSQKSDFGNWLIYIGSKKIDTKLNWHHEVQYRNYNAIGDLEQLLLRTGIGYNLAENNHNILLGYGYINSQNYLEGTNEKKSIETTESSGSFSNSDPLFASIFLSGYMEYLDF